MRPLKRERLRTLMSLLLVIALTFLGGWVEGQRNIASPSSGEEFAQDANPVLSSVVVETKSFARKSPTPWAPQVVSVTGQPLLRDPRVCLFRLQEAPAGRILSLRTGGLRGRAPPSPLS